MRKFILGLAIALAACNIASAKEYITLESSAGNTIVDENGGWILGPYDNLHVDYMKASTTVSYTHLDVSKRQSYGWPRYCSWCCS